jgi:hypothetical protein
MPRLALLAKKKRLAEEDLRNLEDLLVELFNLARGFFQRNIRNLHPSQRSHMPELALQHEICGENPEPGGQNTVKRRRSPPSLDVP